MVILLTSICIMIVKLSSKFFVYFGLVSEIHEGFVQITKLCVILIKTPEDLIGFYFYYPNKLANLIIRILVIFYIQNSIESIDIQLMKTAKLFEICRK